MAAWTVVTPLDVPESATSQKMPHTTKPIAKLCTAEVRRPPIPTPSEFPGRSSGILQPRPLITMGKWNGGGLLPNRDAPRWVLLILGADPT